MGVVYKAEDTRLKRTVALKFLPPAFSLDPDAKARFKRGAKVASGLDHPNICTLHDIDETPDGQIFIAMVYYEVEFDASGLASGVYLYRLAAGSFVQTRKFLPSGGGVGLRTPPVRLPRRSL